MLILMLIQRKLMYFSNFDTNLDKRENFDDMSDFEIIFAQNICFFDIAKSVANKINSIKFFDEIKSEINDEITNDFENKISS